MATFKSTQQTNKDATTGVESAYHGGRVRVAIAKYTTDATEVDGDLFELFEIPRNAILLSMRVYHNAVADFTDCNIGDANDADGLMDGINLSSAGLKHIGAGDGGDGGTNGWVGADDIDKPLWEVLGYSDYDSAPSMITVQLEAIAATSSAASDYFVVVAEYVVD